MGAVTYLLLATILLLLVGWSLYVLPTPGPLSPWELMSALLPAFSIVFGMSMMLGAGYLVLITLRYLGRVWSRAHGILRDRSSQPPAAFSHSFIRVTHLAALALATLIAILVVHAVIAADELQAGRTRWHACSDLDEVGC